MGSLWLHSMPDMLRAAGLRVETWPGWEWRSRSTGGYDAVWGIGVHHDAIRTGVSLEARCRAAWDSTGNPDRPVGAIWLHDDGRVMVGAAGATNTQGRGGPYRTSRGVIPADAGNRYLLSVEASNDGIGTPWPLVQQDAYVLLCAALCDWLDLDPTRDVIAHFEWAPGRKIDPAGQSRYATGRASWRMPQFRADINDFEEDTVKIAYIAQPPADMAGNPPWFVVIDGAVRYATNVDAAVEVPRHRLNREQYQHLHRQVFGETA